MNELLYNENTCSFTREIHKQEYISNQNTLISDEAFLEAIIIVDEVNSNLSPFLNSSNWLSDVGFSRFWIQIHGFERTVLTSRVNSIFPLDRPFLLAHGCRERERERYQNISLNVVGMQGQPPKQSNPANPVR